MTQLRTAATRTAPPEAPVGRTVRRRRALPNGRAVVGGFLVSVAAVGIFSAYASATAPPTTLYAVAARDLLPGDRIDASAVRLVAIDLPDSQRRRAFDAAEPLMDATVIESLLTDELLQEGSVVGTGAAAGARTMSIGVDPSRAVNGAIRPGERVDVLATFGTGADACTHRVASGVGVVDIAGASGSVVEAGGALTVTLALDDGAQSMAVAHAASAGEVTVVRATGAGSINGSGGGEQFCTPRPGRADSEAG